MISYSELKPGMVIMYEGAPYVVLKADFLRKQKTKPVMQTEMRNLKTGKTLQNNFHMSDSIEEADVETIDATYLYNNKGEYWFCEGSDRSKRFSLPDAQVAAQGQYVPENEAVRAMRLEEEFISIIWPIKADVAIEHTVPGEKGNTASGGTKAATLTTGAEIQVPLFINTGDVVRVNTETGQYAERVSKADTGL